MRHTSLQEANTESLASGVGMRFRSGLKGLKGFWACRMRGGASQEQGFVASLDLVHSQNGLLLVYSLFIDYLLPPLPRMPDLVLTLCTPKTVYCLFIRCLLIICCLPSQNAPSQTSQNAAAGLESVCTVLGDTWAAAGCGDFLRLPCCTYCTCSPARETSVHLTQTYSQTCLLPPPAKLACMPSPGLICHMIYT